MAALTCLLISIGDGEINADVPGHVRIRVLRVSLPLSTGLSHFPRRGDRILSEHYPSEVVLLHVRSTGRIMSSKCVWHDPW